MPPFISAWSREALEVFRKETSDEDADLLKWFYGDSPYFNFEDPVLWFLFFLAYYHLEFVEKK